MIIIVELSKCFFLLYFNLMGFTPLPSQNIVKPVQIMGPSDFKRGI
jgi:hypothetical protein